MLLQPLAALLEANRNCSGRTKIPLAGFSINPLLTRRLSVLSMFDLSAIVEKIAGVNGLPGGNSVIFFRISSAVDMTIAGSMGLRKCPKKRTNFGQLCKLGLSLFLQGPNLTGFYSLRAFNYSGEVAFQGFLLFDCFFLTTARIHRWY